MENDSQLVDNENAEIMDLKIQTLLNDIDLLIYQQNKVENVSYRYEGEKNLEMHDDKEIEMASINNTATIKLFIYMVNTENIIPFLQILLYKTAFGLSFIQFKGCESLLEKSQSIIEEIQRVFKVDKCQYKGHFEKGDVTFLFYEIFGIKSHLLLPTNDLWLVLLDEIINGSEFYNIHQSVKDLFLSYIEFGLLTDIKENYFEMPTVAYAGYRKKKLDFHTTFGNPPLQNRYVFKNFISACEDATNYAIQFEDMNKGGVVRFALFLKNVEYNTDTETSDSCIVNDEKANVTFFLKAYNQQCPLTYHFL
jgi:hypothetical protein